MKKLLISLATMAIIPLTAMAEQPQQQAAPPKNYEAIIIENGRQVCEANWAVALKKIDELKAQLAELQKKDTKEEK